MRRKAQGDEMDMLIVAVVVLLVVAVVGVVSILKGGSAIRTSATVSFTRHVTETDTALYALLETTCHCSVTEGISVSEYIGLASAQKKYNVDAQCPGGHSYDISHCIKNIMYQQGALAGYSGMRFNIDGLGELESGTLFGKGVVSSTSAMIPVPGGSSVKVTLEGYE